jgi:hypothetical protein
MTQNSATENCVAKIRAKGNKTIIVCGLRTEAKDRVENGSHDTT